MSSFRINTNVSALNAYNALNKANSATTKAQLRMATGKQINSVADDVSGYNVGKSLDSKVQLMKSAQGNIGSAKDMLSTAESALQQVKDKLTSIRAYVADASDATKDRVSIAKNIASLGDEIKNILGTTKFNNQNLLVGNVAFSSVSAGTSDAYAKSFSFQTGADSSDRITLDFAQGLASNGAVSGANGYSTTSGSETVSSAVANAISSFSALGSQTDDATAAAAIADLAKFVGAGADSTSIVGSFETKINDALGKIGNYSQRLDVKDEYLTSAISNAQSSVSRLFDADMATEQLNATKSSISSQVATSMLSSLNTAPQNVLSLFR